MKIVEFYRGERPNNAGYTLDAIMNFKEGELEMDHDWVQWVFGSNEPSQMNGEAPTLTKVEADIFQADPELQEKVKQSFVKFLGFLKLKLTKDDESGVIIEPEDDTKAPWWMGQFNHTMLRITRVLKSLRLTGNTKYADAFYNCLRRWKEYASWNTWKHWTDAVFNDLWKNLPPDIRDMY